CSFLIERLIVVFITAFVLSLCLLVLGYEASHLPEMISNSVDTFTDAVFWVGPTLLIGLTLIIGYVGMACAGAIVGVVRDAIASRINNRAFWRELNAGAAVTVEGSILAVRGGPLGVAGRAIPLRVLPFKDMIPREIRSGRYCIC